MNALVWPFGLPQVLIIDLQSENGSSRNLKQPATDVQINVDGAWYARDANEPANVAGNWRHYKANRFRSFQLGPIWHRIDDGDSLLLSEGTHSAKIRMTIPDNADGLITLESKAVSFRVVGQDDR